MEIVVVIAIAILLIFAILGAGRAETSRPRLVVVPIATALVAALACHLIGETKTGGYLAGIIGMLGMLVMLIVAAGLALGWLGLHAVRGFKVVPTRAWRIGWDMASVGLLGLACIFLAAIE